jgi:hypothetical protein
MTLPFDPRSGLIVVPTRLWDQRDAGDGQEHSL